MFNRRRNSRNQRSNPADNFGYDGRFSINMNNVTTSTATDTIPHTAAISTSRIDGRKENDQNLAWIE